MFGSILVLESSWDSNSIKSSSVWPFVNEFSRATEVPAFYSAFTDRSSFCHWITRYHKHKVKGPKLLYVAAHGSKGRIAGLRKDVNRETIIKSLAKAKSVGFVHFGSCLFGTDKNLRALLKSGKHIQWAAGYDTSVDWVDSTLFDLLLWGRLATREKEDKGKHFYTLATDLLKETSGLATNLGFHFLYRHGKIIKGLEYPEAEVGK